MNPDSTAALFGASEALGQLSGADAGAFALATPALGPVLLKLALGLGAVIVLILVLQRFARRFGGGLPRRGDPIQLLAQRPLGPRLSLAVVEVMDRTFLVGVSPHGIEKVADLTSARARQNAARALALEAHDLERRHAAQTAGDGEARADDLAGLGWKERLVRSFARVLSGGHPPANPRGRGRSAIDLSAPERSERAGFEVEFRQRLEELQARYPHVSEIDAQPRRGAR
jgi:flagellar biosynthetic protein FliO